MGVERIRSASSRMLTFPSLAATHPFWNISRPTSTMSSRYSRSDFTMRSIDCIKRWLRPMFRSCWWVRDMRVDAGAIQSETGRSPSVCCTHGWALLWGRMASCGRLVIGQLPRRSGRLAGWQPAAGCHPAPQTGVAIALRLCHFRHLADWQSAAGCHPAPHRFCHFAVSGRNRRGARRDQYVVVHSAAGSTFMSRTRCWSGTVGSER